MLKVLQIIPTLDRSGAEKQMALLATGLPRDRFTVEVAALTRLGPLEAELKAAGVPVTLIGKRFKVDPIALRKLARFIRDNQFDVVQTWIFAANVYGRLAARWAKVPVVVTAEMAVDLWKGWANLAIDRYLAQMTSRIVGNSQAVVDFYRDRAGISSGRLELIYSGIGGVEPPEVDAAAVRAELGIAPDASILLYAGRLAAQKGLDDLLKAIDLIQHIRPDDVTLIVGAGPLRARLEAMTRAFDLRKRVRFLGHREDVPRLLAVADLVVLPSLYEGLPNIVLEAMRFRKPVVATSAPGTTELVIDHVTGLLVPPRNHVELARAIRAVLDDRDLAQRLGTAGRARVEADFRADTMIDRFANLYESLAREKGLAL